MKRKGKAEDLKNRPTERINLTQAELQEFCDQWCKNIYHHDVHSGIGQSPLDMASSWKGAVYKVSDQVALDVTLTEVAGLSRNGAVAGENVRQTLWRTMVMLKDFNIAHLVRSAGLASGEIKEDYARIYIA